MFALEQALNVETPSNKVLVMQSTEKENYNYTFKHQTQPL